MTTDTSVQHTVLDALKALAARCDGAREQDGVGFNGRDTGFGKSLALRSNLTPKQEEAARKMLKTYTKQLASLGINVDALATSTYSDQQIADRRASDYAMPANGNGHVTVQQANGRKVKIAGQKIVFSFPYDPAIKDDLKDTFPRRAYFSTADKTWSLPLSDITGAILWGKKWNFDVSALESALIASQQAEQEKVQALDNAFQARMSNVDLENVGSGIVLRAYQKDGVAFLVQRQKAILADDMGLGKTLQGLVASKAYKDHAILVIAPKSLHGDWKKAACSVHVAIEIFTWQSIPAVPEHQKYLVIADEAHYAQNLKSKRTMALIALAEHASALFLLTGTPIKNGRPVNLYPLLSMVNHPIAKNKKHYEQRYCGAHATRFTPWDTTGSTFLEELNEKIADVMLRRTKKACLPDLPEKTRVLRMVEPSAEDSRLYNVTFHCLQSEYKEKIRSGKLSDNGEALVLLTHLRHAASIAKVGSAVELAEEILEQEESIVVFFEFADSVERFISDVRISKYGVSHIDGSTPIDKRDKAKLDFQNGVNKVFACTIKTGGVGLTLTAASTVILVDRPWTPGDSVQSEDRIHRIGQKNACTAYWLRYGHTDEKIDTVLADKAEKIGVVLGDDTVAINYANLASEIF